MKTLESYKKIAKSMLTEHAWDRKFGEPLPTLQDVMKEAEVDDDSEKPEDKPEDLGKGMDEPNDYERDFDDEEIITINGKKYKPVEAIKKLI